MLRLFICSLLLFNISTAFASTYHPIKQSFCGYQKSPYQNYYNNSALSSSDLSALEKYLIKKSYPREHPLKRLERLETIAFGSIQSGSIESRYKNVEAAILSGPAYNTKRSALGNIVNYFAGQATGITPPIINTPSYYSRADNFNNYNFSPSYGNQRLNQYSNGIFGHGYSLLNTGFGNGSSITILP